MDKYFKTAVQKKSYSLYTPVKKNYYNIGDAHIKKIAMLQNKSGYILTVTVLNDDLRFFESTDELSRQFISGSFKDSVCKQNNIVNLFLANDETAVKLQINNKSAALSDVLHILGDPTYRKQYSLTLQVHHIGLYIYPQQCLNKWSIHSVNLYETEEPDVPEDTSEFWKDLVDECDIKLTNHIIQLQNTQTDLHRLYQEIIKEKKSNKEWECKIQEFKKLVQNIIF